MARRAGLWAAHALDGNTSVPLEGPRLQSITVDRWNASWGDYHLGYGSAANVCAMPAFACLGLRLTFDQPLVMAPAFGQVHGYASGFALGFVAGTNQTAPVAVTGVRSDDPATLQLNVTWVSGGPGPSLVLYGWNDYPSMLVYNAWGQPAPPFNASVPL